MAMDWALLDMIIASVKDWQAGNITDEEAMEEIAKVLKAAGYDVSGRVMED